MSNPIEEFLANRLAEKSKGKEEEELAALRAKFDKRAWIADAAKRAKQLNLVTHPGKFSHPDSKISSVLFCGRAHDDGLVRSGNVSIETDVVGNAAALDVYAFLMLVLENGQTVLDHLRQNSKILRSLIGCSEEEYAELSANFLQVEVDGGPRRSSGAVKQVYFPCNGGYHLLSVLTPSGLVSGNYARLQATRFSDEAKAAREARRKNVHSEHATMDFPDHLTMHFGGTKPQNISKLNSSNGGRVYLFRSMPPEFTTDSVRAPHRDFFREVKWDDELRDLISKLHRLLALDFNNVDIRRGRDRRIEQIVDWLLFRAYRLQTHTPGWSDNDKVKLPISQIVWLDRKRFDERNERLNWAEEIDRSAADWLLTTYRKMHRKQPIELGQVERDTFQAEIREFTRLSKREWL